MDTVIDIRGKTEQRVTAIIQTMEKHPQVTFTYEDLAGLTGAHYDACLYILATLCEVGIAERVPDNAEGPGRPRVRFRWVGARDLGSRKHASAAA